MHELVTCSSCCSCISVDKLEYLNICVMFVERLKREEQGRLEQEKWKRRMESESVEAQEQLSDLGMLAAELKGSLAQKEKEITTLQGR